MWFDASTSHARPPAGVTADPSQYGLLGGRLHADLELGSITLSGRLGDALSGSEGRWLHGDATVVAGARVGPVGVRGLLSGFALGYLQPFAYDASGLELRPTASVPVGPFVVSAQPRITTGGWTTDALEGSLLVVGGDVSAERAFGAFHASISAGAVQVENGVTQGVYSGVEGALTLDRGQWVVGADLRVQRTPLETELGGTLQGAWIARPGLRITATAGRRVRDPLFGTAGSLSLSLGVALRAVRWSPPAPPPVAAIGEDRADGRVVRFAIRAPGAETVALSGNFTGWDPLPMETTGDGWWAVERVLEPGLHHFGFLVDGEWALPPDAPGVVDDGWGRRNASIVVEP